jgi:hypothetical protein
MPTTTSTVHQTTDKQAVERRQRPAPTQQLAPTQTADGLQRAVAEPSAARPSDILTLQRQYGNQAVQRLLARHAVQAKVRVGPAGDAYEQEADRVADQVMTMPTLPPASHRPAVQRAAEEDEEPVQAKPLAASIRPLVQRAAEEDEEPIQAKPLAASIKPLVQRAAEEDEEPVQAKPLVQRAAEEDEEPVQAKREDPRAGFDAGSMVEDQLHAQKGSGSPLPGEVRAFMEPRFGADFSGVRVHTGGEASQLNRQLSAQAFTHGQDIYVGEGHYSPGSEAGQRLLAHELTHVVQQTGSVQRHETPLAAPQLKQEVGTVQRLTLQKVPDLPQLWAAEVDETGNEEEGYKEIHIMGTTKFFWVKPDALELFMTGHLMEGGEAHTLEAFVDTEMWGPQPVPQPAPQAEPKKPSFLSKAWSGIKKAGTAIGSGLKAAGAWTGSALKNLFIGAKETEPKAMAFNLNRLMTVKEFTEAAGVTRRRLIARKIVGASYDAVIGFLDEYHNLKENDPKGKQVFKRMEILKDLLTQAELWAASANRKKAGSHDVAKQAVLEALHQQVQHERLGLLALDPEAKQKTGAITSGTVVPEDKTLKPAPKEATDPIGATTVGGKIKDFFARNFLKMANVFKYTFGGDFRPEYAIGFNPKTLTPTEMQEMVDLIDAAMEVEKRLLAEAPDDKLGAMTKAYMYLPPQLRPKTPDDEEKVVLQTKQHLFKEAIAAKKKSKLQEGLGYGDTATSLGKTGAVGLGGVSGTISSVTEKLGKIGVLDSDEQKSYFKDVGKVAGFVGKVGGKKEEAKTIGLGRMFELGLAEHSKPLLETADITEKIGAISNSVGAFGGILNFLLKIGQSKITKIVSKDPLERKMGLQAIKELVPPFLDMVKKAITTSVKAAQAFGSAIPKSVVPIVGAVFGFINLLVHIYEGGEKLVRVVREKLILKEAKTKAQHLVGAIGSFMWRNVTLAVRAGVKMIVDALQAVGGVLQAIPDPSGTTQGVGTALSTVGTVISVLESVGEALHESYRAGVRQESELQAETGKSGSSKKVMKNSPRYAATAIILEAKSGNAVAVKSLHVYGVTDQMIAKNSVDQIRDQLFHKLEETEEPKTITQKILGIFATLGLRGRV